MYEIIKEFKKIGNELFQAHLNNFHSGNLSVLKENYLYITATGSKLGFLEESDIVKLDFSGDEVKNASCELPVHKAIYKNTSAKAIVHAHSPYSVALSFFFDVIKPIDGEGKFYFKNGIPVLSVENSVASDEVANGIPELFEKSNLVIVRGHGAFAIGESLKEAAKWISSVENSCQIIYMKTMYEKGL
jgi:L-fuculose-phosphate aldolase